MIATAAFPLRVLEMVGARTAPIHQKPIQSAVARYQDSRSSRWSDTASVNLLSSTWSGSTAPLS